MAQPRILIAGAGIAGLALERALGNQGITADVVERGSEPRTTGAGLYLPANAVRALRRLGLGAELAERAQQVTRQRMLDHRGRPLTRYEVRDIWGDVGDCYAITRAGLHDLLRSTGRTPVRFGVGVETADAQGRVTFTDGTQDSYDLVVGADGIDSAVRSSAFAGATPRFLNQICWRFLARDSAGEIRAGEWTARLGSNGRGFLTLPLGDGRVYCYADTNSARPTPPDGDWRALFADFAGPVPALLEQGADAYFAALEEIDDTDWARPHAVLIGDAAHACSPSMAQGGAMALEDTLVLAELLAGAADRAAVPAAVSAYRDRRVARIQWVLAQNHRRDKTRTLPAALRNFVLKRWGVHIFRANHTGLLPPP